MSQITVEQFKECIPKGMHRHVNQDFVDGINNCKIDTEVKNQFRDNLLQHADVFKDGRYKLLDYVNASLYVALKMQGKGKLEAWKIVFKDRYAKHRAKGTSDKDLYSYSSMYDKGKLVQAISERSMASDHVLFCDVRHQVIKRQLEIAMSPNENVAQKACDSLMNHLKAPETTKVQVDVNGGSSGVIESLEATMLKMAQQQQEMIAGGYKTAKEVAQTPITIDGEVDE